MFSSEVIAGIAMSPDFGGKDNDERPSEDDIARAKLGPRGVPGEPDTDRMTPQRRKKTPAGNRDTPEHTALRGTTDPGCLQAYKHAAAGPPQAGGCLRPQRCSLQAFSTTFLSERLAPWTKQW